MQALGAEALNTMLQLMLLIVPGNHYCDNRRCFVIYSDDHGQSWRLGGQIGPKVSECQAVELADGRLLLNMRSYRGNHCRVVAYSSDGGLNWTDFGDAPELVELVCQGSFLRCSLAGTGGKNRLLFCNPADAKQRIRLTVRRSHSQPTVCFKRAMAAAVSSRAAVGWYGGKSTIFGTTMAEYSPAR